MSTKTPKSLTIRPKRASRSNVGLFGAHAVTLRRFWAGSGRSGPVQDRSGRSGPVPRRSGPVQDRSGRSGPVPRRSGPVQGDSGPVQGVLGRFETGLGRFRPVWTGSAWFSPVWGRFNPADRFPLSQLSAESVT